MSIVEHGTPKRAFFFVAHVEQEQQCGATIAILTSNCALQCARGVSLQALSPVSTAMVSEEASVWNGIRALLKIVGG